MQTTGLEYTSWSLKPQTDLAGCAAGSKLLANKQQCAATTNWQPKNKRPTGMRAKVAGTTSTVGCMVLGASSSVPRPATARYVVVPTHICGTAAALWYCLQTVPHGLCSVSVYSVAKQGTKHQQVPGPYTPRHRPTLPHSWAMDKPS